MHTMPDDIVVKVATAGPKDARERLKKEVSQIAREHNCVSCGVRENGEAMMFEVRFSSGDKGQAITFQNVLAEQPYFKFVKN